MATPAQQQSFLGSIIPLANSYGERYNIDPNLIVAQAALESNWGTSKAATTQNDFFGLKTPAAAASGAVVYQSFGSLEDSVAGYAKLLSSNPRYANVLGKTGSDAINSIAGDGYAEDPNYGTKLAMIQNTIGTTGADLTAVGSSLSDKAIGLAEGAIGLFSGNPLMIAKGAYDAATAGGSNVSSIDKLLAWLRGVFSANTAARWVAVAVGIVLIAIALAYLTGADKAVKVVVSDAAKAAAVVA